MPKSKKNKYPLIVKTRPKEMKAWQDCQWKRIACQKDDCPICGPIKRDREERIKKGEDPDTMEAALDHVGNVFKETIKMLHKDAKKMGIDLDNLEDVEVPRPPQPNEWPLYIEASNWQKRIYDLAEESDDVSSAWLYSEAGQDLLWYANTLLAKIYRQLSSVWRMENDEREVEYMDLEYGYTGFVLGEVVKLLDKALLDLSRGDYPQAKQFNLARLNFDSIKQKIYESST